MTSIIQRIFIAVLFFCFATSVVAQVKLPTSNTGSAEITLPDPLTPETVRNLVSTLSDAQVRAMLLERLDAVAKNEVKSNPKDVVSLLDFVNVTSQGVFLTVHTAVKRLPLLWSSQKESFGNFQQRLGAKGLITLFGSLFLALAAGLVAEFAVGKITRHWHANALAIKHPDTLGETVRFLMYRLLHELYGLIAFFIVARLITGWILPLDLLPVFKVIVFNMIVVPRIGAAFARFFLAPKKPEIRLLHTDDASAGILYRHLIGMLLLIGFTIAIVEFNDLNGVPIGTTYLGFWLNISIHIYAIWIIWRTWDGLVMIQRGRQDVTAVEDQIGRASCRERV